MPNFESRVKQVREQAQMTQKELANKVGVRRETIVFLEQGKYIPSLKLAFRIAKVFNTKIEELFKFNQEQLWKDN